MRRASRDRLKKSGFSGGSAAGEDGDLSDPEPSEAGSLHSRDARKHKTIEERQAAYQTARERIFQDFQEKEREREKDGSATSSTFSGAPGSASTSAAPSTVDDLESESVAAESEWSATGSRDRRRGNGSASSRPWKPNGYRSGSHSARGSRGTSPSSIQYPSIYEPPAPVQYEGAPAPGVPPPPGYAHYGYSYAPQQGQGPGQPYMAPFPQYYQHQSYAYPTHPTHHSDPTTPAATDIYGQYPLQPHMYPGGYAWPPMSAPPMQQISTSPPQHPVPPPTMHVPHTAPYLPPQQYMQPPAPYAPYQPQGYYVPPPHNGQMPPPPPPHQMHGQPMYSMDPVRSMSGSHHGTTPGHSRASSRSSQGRRSAPPVRSAWSYGPGATGGAYYGSDVVGPRMGGIRRMSGASSVGSGSTGNRTPGGDDASSTVVSYFYSFLRDLANLDSPHHPVIVNIVIIGANVYFYIHIIKASAPSSSGLGDRSPPGRVFSAPRQRPARAEQWTRPTGPAPRAAPAGRLPAAVRRAAAPARARRGCVDQFKLGPQHPRPRRRGATACARECARAVPAARRAVGPGQDVRAPAAERRGRAVQS